MSSSVDTSSRHPYLRPVDHSLFRVLLQAAGASVAGPQGAPRGGEVSGSFDSHRSPTSPKKPRILVATQDWLPGSGCFISFIRVFDSI